MSQSQQGLTPHIVASHIERTAHRILGDHIPHATDAIIGGVTTIERRMRQVKPHIHHSHHDALSCKGLRQVLTSMGRLYVEVLTDMVVGETVTPPGLDAQNAGVERESPQLVNRNADDMHVACAGQHTTAMILKRLRVRDFHKGTELF